MKQEFKERILLQKLAGLIKENIKLTEGEDDDMRIELDSMPIFTGEYTVYLSKEPSGKYVYIIKIGDRFVGLTKGESQEVLFGPNSAGKIISVTGCGCEDFYDPISDALVQKVNFKSVVQQYNKKFKK